MCTFEGNELLVANLKLLILRSLYEWELAASSYSMYSFLAWILNSLIGIDYGS